MAALPENDRIAGPFIAVAGQTDVPADFPLIRRDALRLRIKRDGVALPVETFPDIDAVDEGIDGFTMRRAVPFVTGDEIWVYSELPAARLRQHTPNGAIRTTTLEGDAVEMQAQLQEARRDLGRAVVVSPGEIPPSPADLAAAANAGEKIAEALDKANSAAARDGANIDPDDEAPAFREAIQAAPKRLATYDDGVSVRLRDMASKLSDVINAQDAPDFALGKTVCQRAGLEALFANRAQPGRAVELPAGQIYLCGLDIPDGVRVVGSAARPGEEVTERDYGKLGTIIWLDPGDDGLNTIRLGSLAQLENVTILNPRLEYVRVVDGVPNLTEAQALGLAPITTGPNAGRLAGVAQFAGTAVTNVGYDNRLKSVLIIGFNDAYVSGPTAGMPLGVGPSRMHLEDVWFDCTNGIDISDCWDIPRVINAHGWNFFTGHTGYSWAAIRRTGTAYHMHDHVDGLMMTNCFAIGWRCSYHFKDIYAAQITACTGDGVVEGTLADPLSIGLLTEGVVSGLHLNSVRCDGNKTNFAFRHVTGMANGSIISGQTASGTHIEIGEASNGVTLDAVVGGAAVDAIRVKSAARNVVFRSITAYYMPDLGELVKFDNPADLKSVHIGVVNREEFGAGTNSYGHRVRDKIVAGGRYEAVVEMRGADAGAVQVAAVSSAEASIDVEARGNLPDASVVSLTRRTLASLRQVLARFDAAAIVPPNFLFRGQAVDTLNVLAEGASDLIDIVLTPKGGGAVKAAGPLFAGVDQLAFVHLRGSGAAGEVRADGAGTDLSLDLVGKGVGGVRLFDLSGGVKRIIARFARTSDIAASPVIVAASDTQVTYGAEGGAPNVTAAITGKGTGGVRIETPGGTYENDAAAAAAGVPVGSTYVMAGGYLRKRLV